VLGLILGMLAVSAFSTNQHDKELEAAMTGAFCVGPVLAVLGIMAGLALYWHRAKRTGENISPTPGE
jgi:hypothetical protein